VGYLLLRLSCIRRAAGEREVKLNLDIERPADKLLALFVITNLFLLYLDVFHFFTGLLGDPLFELENDEGLGQFFRFFQEFWIVLMLLLMAFRKWRFLCASWGMLFAVYLCDDSMEIHESLGLLLSQQFHLPSVLGMRPRDLGEIIAFGTWGVGIMSLVAVAHWLSGPEARRFSRGLLGLVVLLAIVSVGSDVLQAIIHGTWTHAAVGKVEETGSLTMVSIIVWYLLRQGGEEVKAA
jgi:hypothetical protein